MRVLVSGDVAWPVGLIWAITAKVYGSLERYLLVDRAAGNIERKKECTRESTRSAHESDESRLSDIYMLWMTHEFLLTVIRLASCP